MNVNKVKFLTLEYLSKIRVINKLVHIDIENLPEFDVSDCRVHLIVSSSNNVFEIIKGEEKYYFRECRKSETADVFVQSVLDDFSNLTGIDIRRYVDICSVNKFMNMGTLGTHEDPVNMYFNTHDLSLCGLLPTTEFLGSYEQVDLFIHYAWGEVLAFKLNRGGGNYQLFNYNRGKSQEVIYNLFSIGNIICPISLVKIKKQEGGYRVGSIMRKAQGVSPCMLTDNQLKNMLSIPMMCTLNSFNIMDALCRETDHRPDNYNVILDDAGRCINIQAFDNDSPMCFFPTSNVKLKYSFADPIIKDGALQRKFISRKFAETFLGVKKGDLANSLKPFLSRLQLFFLCRRFDKIQSALKTSIRKHEILLLSETDQEGNLMKLEENNFTYAKLLERWNKISAGISNEVYERQHQIPPISVTF